jgi:hypothetical protein
MNISISSFTKGEEFEKYVEKYLFPKEYYDVIHRTNTYEQNKERFAEDTIKPDFKFRCKKTNKEFYVEAKFRTKFNNAKKIEVISLSQLRRFEKLQEEEKCPIYMIIGYGGKPSNPTSISIIPVEKMEHLSLYETYLRKYKINKNSINCDILKIEKLTNNIIKKKNIRDNKKSNYISKLVTQRKKLIVMIPIIILIAVIVGLIKYTNTSRLSKNDVEIKLKERVSQYYTNLELRNINDLDEFLNPKIDKWYGKSNVSLNEIKIEVAKYYKKYPFTKTEILWDTFKVSKLNNDYLVSYKMIYKIRGIQKKKVKTFYLKIISIWDKNYKINSIIEEKN